MIAIRLSRGGARKRPFYHIVATDMRKRRDSGYLERLGYFNPVATGDETLLQIDQERVSYWLSQGAKPSERAAHLIRCHTKGVSPVRPHKEPVRMAPKAVKEEEAAPEEPVAEAKPAEPQEPVAEAKAASEEPAAEAQAAPEPAEDKPAD